MPNSDASESFRFVLSYRIEQIDNLSNTCTGRGWIMEVPKDETKLNTESKRAYFEDINSLPFILASLMEIDV